MVDSQGFTRADLLIMLQRAAPLLGRDGGMSEGFGRRRRKGTRPDTQPPVADGWAGAEMRVFPLFNSSMTDGPTDQQTDGRTKPLIELRVRN